MIKRATSLILVTGLTLIACVGVEQSEMPLNPDTNSSSNIVVQEESPDTNSLAESPPSSTVVPQVIVKTDSKSYRQGESLVVTIENNSSDPIQFTEICSLHLCIESGKDWICEERECDGSTIVIEPESRLEILQEAMLIVPKAKTDVSSRYKLDYQIVSEDPYYFAHSNEFTVRSEGLNCMQAKQVALEDAKSSPYWNSIDLSRATVRWQGENQSCMVDFAWQGAEQIRTGLWSEGYYVLVSARSGQVIEASAYER